MLQNNSRTDLLSYSSRLEKLITKTRNAPDPNALKELQNDINILLNHLDQQKTKYQVRADISQKEYSSLLTAIYIEAIYSGLMFKGFSEFLIENRQLPDNFKIIETDSQSSIIEFTHYQDFYFPLTTHLADLLQDLQKIHILILKRKKKQPHAKPPYSSKSFPDLSSKKDWLKFLFPFEQISIGTVTAVIEHLQSTAGPYYLNSLCNSFKYIPKNQKNIKREDVHDDICQKLTAYMNDFCDSSSPDNSEDIQLLKEKLGELNGYISIVEVLVTHNLIEEVNSIFLDSYEDYQDLQSRRENIIEEMLCQFSPTLNPVTKLAEINAFCSWVINECPGTKFIEIFINLIRYRVHLDRGHTSSKTNFSGQRMLKADKINQFIDSQTNQELKIYFILAFYTGLRSIDLRYLTIKNIDISDFEEAPVVILTFISNKMHHAGRSKLSYLVPDDYLIELFEFIEAKELAGENSLFSLERQEIRQVIKEFWGIEYLINFHRKNFASHMLLTLSTVMNESKSNYDSDILFAPHLILKSFGTDPETLIAKNEINPFHLTGDALHHSINSDVLYLAYLDSHLLACYISIELNQRSRTA